MCRARGKCKWTLSALSDANIIKILMRKKLPQPRLCTGSRPHAPFASCISCCNLLRAFHTSFGTLPSQARRLRHRTEAWSSNISNPRHHASSQCPLSPPHPPRTTTSASVTRSAPRGYQGYRSAAPGLRRVDSELLCGLEARRLFTPHQYYLPDSRGR